MHSIQIKSEFYAQCLDTLGAAMLCRLMMILSINCNLCELRNENAHLAACLVILAQTDMHGAVYNSHNAIRSSIKIIEAEKSALLHA
jgi:hypothetical protein